MREGTRVREPVVDGIFYPSDSLALRKELERLTAGCEEEPGHARAIVSPHAAYEFSGPFAATAFNAAAARTVTSVVIIAPVHREPSDQIFLTESSYFSTPLGNVPVADELTTQIMDCSTRFVRNDIPHLEEHAIEVQLPFIQWFFPDADIVPILLARANRTNVRILSQALNMVFADRIDQVLFVASSNLCSHTDPALAQASKDMLLAYVERENTYELLNAFHRKDVTACGTGCIATILSLGISGLKGRFLGSATNIPTDDDRRSIHYGALAFVVEPQPSVR